MFAELSKAANGCDVVPAIPDFNAEAYMGTWYEQIHTMNQAFQADTDVCQEAIYSDLDSEGHFVIYNSGQPEGYGERAGVKGTGYCPDSDGQVFVHFGGPQPRKPNLHVVETDYTSYAVAYDCGIFKPLVWLITREQNPPASLIDKMMGIAEEALPNFDFSTLNHQNYQGAKCSYAAESSPFYYPMQ